MTNVTNFHYPLSIQYFKYWFFMRTSQQDFISTHLFIHNWTSRFETSKQKNMFCLKRSYLKALRICSLFNFRHRISFYTLLNPRRLTLVLVIARISLLSVHDNRIAIVTFLATLSFNNFFDFLIILCEIKLLFMWRIVRFTFSFILFTEYIIFMILSGKRLK